MALRKARSYSKKYVVPYTRRSKLKSKSYVKTVPPQEVVKFTMGNQKFFEQGKLPYHLILISTEDIQIRSNALEASRQFVNRNLETSFPGQYLFMVKTYPHHIQRENKMLTGAGSDRMQTGMQLSFGKAIARAAIVKKGGKIFFFAFQNKKATALARKLLHQIKAKLPCKTRILYEETAVEDANNEPE
ncbi:MAG: 50S ribosomal protein L16 [Nanoarchaeota archaeon]|nr:50S ribosomal protein L16 [Nanoarchaeota archaeon]